MKRNKEILVRLALKNKFPPEKVLPLEKEIAESGKDIADFLQENNLCTEAEFFNVIADMFCVPFSEMPVLEVDKTLLETFDNSFLRKNNIVPVRKMEDGTLVVATGEKFEILPAEKMKDISSLDVNPENGDIYIGYSPSSEYFGTMRIYDFEGKQKGVFEVGYFTSGARFY